MSDSPAKGRLSFLGFLNFDGTTGQRQDVPEMTEKMRPIRKTVMRVTIMRIDVIGDNDVQTAARCDVNPDGFHIPKTPDAGESRA